MFDLVAWGSSAARNGLTAVPPLEAGSLSGYQVINTNFIRAKGAGNIEFMQCISAAIANLDEYRLGVNSKNYAHSRRGRDQTSVPHEGTLDYLNYPLKAGDLLHVDVDNANNAQVEVVLAALAPQPCGLGFTKAHLPANCRPIAGLSSTAAVALTWTNVVPVWTETFEQDQTYQIVGLSGDAATMYALRLSFTAGPMMAYHPGVPGGDSRVLQQPLFGNFGTFQGATPPNIEVLCSGADASQCATMWVVPARKD